MFKTFTAFCKFFKSLILPTLWIYDFCDFMSYCVFGLYCGSMDFSHSLQPQGHRAEPIRQVDFRDRFDIILEMMFSGVGEQGI